ncbi:hypothetical protein OH784_12635 [Ectobacillus funiculus]|uniref:hypothetical protein n=1 Tax=Ectobacillus funiculus TaxID=137993 RepID=UPI00397B67F0
MNVTHIQVHVLGNYQFEDAHATIEIDGDKKYTVYAKYTRRREVKIIHDNELPAELEPLYNKMEKELNRRIRGLHSARLIFGEE